MARVVEKQFDRMLTVRLIGFGRFRPGRSLPTYMTLLLTLAVSLVPLVIEVVTFVVAPSYALHTERAVFWVLALSLLVFFGTLCAWHAWMTFVRYAPELDALVSGARKRRSLSLSLEQALSLSRQVVVSLIGAIGCSIVLRLAQPYVGGNLEIGVISYVSMFWSTFIGSNCAYWIAFFMMFSRKVLVSGELHLVWHSPASTAGISSLSRTFAFSTTATLIALAYIEFLAVRVSSYGTGEALRIVINVVPFVAFLGLIGLGLYPHWRLFVVVRDARVSALRALAPLTGSTLPRGYDELTSRAKIVEIYRLVETSPGLPFSTSAFVQYFAAILGSIVAFALTR